MPSGQNHAARTYQVPSLKSITLGGFVRGFSVALTHVAGFVLCETRAVITQFV